jgi:hypothetical protein
MDEAESAFEFYNANLGGKRKGKNNRELVLIARHAKNIQAAVSAYIHNKNGAELSRWILELPGIESGPKSGIAQVVLAEAALDDELSAHNRLRLLIVHWAAWELRAWTKRLKGGGH